MYDPVVFSRARAGWRPGVISMVAVPEVQGEYLGFSLFYWYRHFDPPETQWGVDRLEFEAIDIATYQRPSTQRKRFCLLSKDGEIVFIEDPNHLEWCRPKDSYASGSAFGRMNSLRSMGSALVACGNDKQIYRRDPDSSWSSLKSLLPDPSRVIDRDHYRALGGIDESDFYVGGSNGEILHFDKNRFSVVNSGVSSRLNDIFVDEDNIAWICGRAGVLLSGNSDSGFKRFDTGGLDAIFTSITKFNGDVYIASAGRPRCLFKLSAERLLPVSCNLDPGIVDIHTVDTDGESLWCVGAKDILRFDGKTWERIHFPGNASR